METLKSILAKIGTGFLYGLGIMIAVGLFSVGASWFMSQQFDEEFFETNMGFTSYDESAMLEAIVDTETIGDGEFTLLGRLANGGETTWKQVTLKAEMFDVDGKFINECTDYVSQELKPGEEIYFKMNCGASCNRMDMSSYASYRLLITDANDF